MRVIDNQLYIDKNVYDEYVMTNRCMFDTYTPIDDIDVYVDTLIAEIESKEQCERECMFIQNNEVAVEELLLIAA